MILEDLQYVSYLMVNKESKYFWPEHKSNDLLKMQDIGTYLIFFHRKVENALIKSYQLSKTTNCIALFSNLLSTPCKWKITICQDFSYLVISLSWKAEESNPDI